MFDGLDFAGYYGRTILHSEYSLRCFLIPHGHMRSDCPPHEIDNTVPLISIRHPPDRCWFSSFVVYGDHHKLDDVTEYYPRTRRSKMSPRYGACFGAQFFKDHPGWLEEFQDPTCAVGGEGEEIVM